MARFNVARAGHKPGSKIQSGADKSSMEGITMTEEQKDRIEAKLNEWNRQATQAEQEGRQDAAYKLIIGKIDAAIELLSIAGYVVYWTGKDFKIGRVN